MALDLDPRVEQLINLNLVKCTLALKMLNGIPLDSKINRIAAHGARLQIELGSRIPAELARIETANRLIIGTWDDCAFKPTETNNG